jgi:hypothetical protein
MATTTISIIEAKQRLGEIADRAIEDEHVVIVRKSKLLVLKPLELPEPVPMRPPGYFQDCYDKDAVKESNRLAAQCCGRARYAGISSGRSRKTIN